MLADFIATKKWDIDYPPHDIPKHRLDLTINCMVVTAGLAAIGVWLLIRLLR